VTTDVNGHAEFLCNGSAVSVWIPTEGIKGLNE
jgi:hypothetical protein